MMENESREIKTGKDLIEWVDTLYRQNLNCRETSIEKYKQGIEDALEELEEQGVLKYPFEIK